MTSMQVVPRRPDRLARPGRPALVAANLAALQGPQHGLTELPLRLAWQPPRVFDLDDLVMAGLLYETVLREAAQPEDLSYLNGEKLTALWPLLYLPQGVRRAWEDQHPVLRAATAAV